MFYPRCITLDVVFILVVQSQDKAQEPNVSEMCFRTIVMILRLMVNGYSIKNNEFSIPSNENGMGRVKSNTTHGKDGNR